MVSEDRVEGYLRVAREGPLEEQLKAIRMLSHAHDPRAYDFFDRLVEVETIRSRSQEEYEEMYRHSQDMDHRIPNPFERHYLSFNALGELGDVIRREFEIRETKERNGGVDYLWSDPHPLTDHAEDIMRLLMEAKTNSDHTR